MFFAEVHSHCVTSTKPSNAEYRQPHAAFYTSIHLWLLRKDGELPVVKDTSDNGQSLERLKSADIIAGVDMVAGLAKEVLVSPAVTS